MRILVAEDDEFLAGGLRLGLEQKGYAVDAVRSGMEAAIALREVGYDLLVLDLGLPGLDGVDVLKGLRREGQSLPVIVITARDSIEDRIQGLDLGANDYLTKPFDFRELEARIRALLRKNAWGNKMEIVHGPIRFLTNSREVVIDGKTAELTPREVAVLELLLQRVGRLVGKRQLMEQVAGWEEEPSENAIEIVIHRLRRKLEDADVCIRTVRGFGYMLEDLE
ncbi:MAG: response regulator transcription factor [Candidatus Melainabacteria bacterium]|nr:response regulator transcription factor [Candidatus Melainabacteria bacterium]